MSDSNPCANCGCHEHDSLVDLLTKRTARLLSLVSTKLTQQVPPDIAERTTPDKVFGFGVDQWIADPQTDAFVVRLRAAIAEPGYRSGGGHDHWRFYGVSMVAPGTVPQPYEDKQGSTVSASITGFVSLTEVKEILDMSDDAFAAWIAESMDALIKFVIEKEGGEAAC